MSPNASVKTWIRFICRFIGFIILLQISACTKQPRVLEEFAQDLQVVDGHIYESLIGHGSWKYHAIYVIKGFESQLMEKLRVDSIDEHTWALPSETGVKEEFNVHFVDYSILFSIEPRPGDFRGFRSATCTKKVAATKSKCEETTVTVLRKGKKVKVKAWKIAETKEHLVCERADVTTICLETYVKIGEMKLYKDKDCKELFTTLDLCAFACSASK